VAQRCGVDVTLEKVEDIREITGYGVMATPAVVVDGVVVHAGGIPSAGRVEEWLRKLGKTGASCCGAKTSCCG
jgi:hypothetical protein